MPLDLLLGPHINWPAVLPTASAGNSKSFINSDRSTQTTYRRALKRQGTRTLWAHALHLPNHMAPAHNATLALDPADANPSGSQARFRGPCNFYRDVFGGWRWEFKDAEGEMRDSPHCYETYEDCVAAAERAGLHAPCPIEQGLDAHALDDDEARTAAA